MIKDTLTRGRGVKTSQEDEVEKMNDEMYSLSPVNGKRSNDYTLYEKLDCQQRDKWG